MVLRNICILMSLLSINLYADSLLDSYYQTQPAQSSNYTSKLDQQYTTSKMYNSMSQVAMNLQVLGITTKIINKQESEVSNILISSNGTFKDFINKAANSFGYTWSISIDNSIIFTAINPIKPKPLTPKKISASNPINTINMVPSTSTIKIFDNWNYSVDDKYISKTLAKWAKHANYQLIWKAENDFELQSSGSINGIGFKSAVNEVLKSYKNTEQPLKATWYKNNVVVISNF